MEFRGETRRSEAFFYKKIFIHNPTFLRILQINKTTRCFLLKIFLKNLSHKKILLPWMLLYSGAFLRCMKSILMLIFGFMRTILILPVLLTEFAPMLVPSDLRFTIEKKFQKKKWKFLKISSLWPLTTLRDNLSSGLFEIMKLQVMPLSILQEKIIKSSDYKSSTLAMSSQLWTRADKFSATIKIWAVSKYLPEMKFSTSKQTMIWILKHSEEVKCVHFLWIWKLITRLVNPILHFSKIIKPLQVL